MANDNNQKYEIIPDSKKETCDGYTIYRIRALRDIPKYGVKKYGYGGYIENYKNLEQKGDCWVGGNAKVYGHSFVQDNAIVKDNAIVRHSHISGNATVQDSVIIDESIVCFNAVAKDNARIRGNSIILHNAIVKDRAYIDSSCHISDNAIIKNNCSLISCMIDDNVTIGHDVNLRGVRIQGNAIIKHSYDYVSISNFWSKDIYKVYDSSYDSIVYTKSNNKYSYGSNFKNLNETQVLKWLVEREKGDIEIKAFKEIFQFVKRLYALNN